MDLAWFRELNFDRSPLNIWATHQYKLMYPLVYVDLEHSKKRIQKLKPALITGWGYLKRVIVRFDMSLFVEWFLQIR